MQYMFVFVLLVVVLFVNHVVLRILLLLDQEVRETKLSPFNPSGLIKDPSILSSTAPAQPKRTSQYSYVDYKDH